MDWQTYSDQAGRVTYDNETGISEVKTRNGQVFWINSEDVDGPWERQHYVSLADVVLHYGRNPGSNTKPFLLKPEYTQQEAEHRFDEFYSPCWSDRKAWYYATYRSMWAHWNRRSKKTACGYKLEISFSSWCFYTKTATFISDRGCWGIKIPQYIYDQWGNRTYIDTYDTSYLNLSAWKCNRPGQRIGIKIDISRIPNRTIRFEYIYDFVLGIRNNLGTRTNIFPAISDNYPYLGF